MAATQESSTAAAKVQGPSANGKNWFGPDLQWLANFLRIELLKASSSASDSSLRHSFLVQGNRQQEAFNPLSIRLMEACNLHPELVDEEISSKMPPPSVTSYNKKERTPKNLDHWPLVIDSAGAGQTVIRLLGTAPAINLDDHPPTSSSAHSPGTAAITPTDIFTAHLKETFPSAAK